MTQEVQGHDGSAPQAAPQAEGSGTTVITVGLTPPVIGGGLVLAYLGIRRMSSSAGGRRAATAAQDAAAGAGEGATKVGEAAATVAGTAVSTATNALQTGRQSAGRVIQTAAQATAQTAGKLRQTVGTAASATVTRAGALPQAVRDNPALGAAIGLGTGALVALAIPPTPPEREVLGPAGQTIAAQLRTGAQETVERVQLVAEEAGTTIRESATQVGLVPVGGGSDEPPA